MSTNRYVVKAHPNVSVTGLDATHESSIKRHFLESELKTADDLIEEYETYARIQMREEAGHAASRLKLVWLLERLQEEVL